MALSNNEITSISENMIENEFETLEKTDCDYNILVNNVETIVLQNKEMFALQSDLLSCNEYLLMAIGLVFGGLCCIIFNSFINR